MPRHATPVPSVRRTRLAVAAVGAVTALTGIGLAVPSTAAEPLHSDTGTVTAPSTGVYSASEVEFFATGCTEPLTQGTDSWIFQLPAALAGAGRTVTLRASDPAASLGGYLYNADCTLADATVPAGTGSSTVALTETETWVVAFSTDPDVALTPLDITLELTPTPGATTTATSTATSTATATATSTTTTAPGGTRGTYSATPDDPLFLDADGPALLNPGQWGLRQVRAPEAWQERQATGFGIKVAVLDSGLDLQTGQTPSVHPDFRCPGKVQLLPDGKSDADDDGKTVPHDDVEGHGTHVAGIIGACTGNGTGIAGVAPDATIVPVQSLSASSGDIVAELARDIDNAVAGGAHVINMSLGYSLAPGGVSLPASGSAAYYLGFWDEIDQAVERAVAAGTVVVAAAGNESMPVCGYPAISEDIVCVGSTDARELNTWYGNFPVKEDAEDLTGAALLAPGGAGVASVAGCGLYVTGDIAGEDAVRDQDDLGEEVLSTFARDVDAEFDCDGRPGYAPLQGTSMASPHVAGVAALVYDRLGGTRNEANGRRVVQAMLDTAKDLYTPGYDPMSGYGRVDALDAVLSIPVVEPTSTPTPTATASATPEPLGTTTRLSAPATTQVTDAVELAATVLDEDGAPVTGASIAFTLAGEGTSTTSSALTGADGTARTTVTPTAAGSFRATASYAGAAGSYTSSSAARDVTVTREDSSTALTTSGNGSSRTITVRVSDADTAASGVAGGTVVVYDRGTEIGRLTTDGSGVASMTAPSGSRGAGSRFGASFVGDAVYAASATGETPAGAPASRSTGALL